MQTEPFDYNSVFVGGIFRSTFVITEELVKSYVEAVEGLEYVNKVPCYLFLNYNPVYDAFGGRIAQGTIHIKQEVEHYGQVNIHDEFEVVVTVKEKFKKNNKDYLVFKADFIKDNLLVCRKETTHLWAFAEPDI